jgi:hypothetical protein
LLEQATWATVSGNGHRASLLGYAGRQPRR